MKGTVNVLLDQVQVLLRLDNRQDNYPVQASHVQHVCASEVPCLNQREEHPLSYRGGGAVSLARRAIISSAASRGPNLWRRLR